MKKFEELIDLINTKHPEWKNLTVRGLKDISGYSHDASRQALLIVKPNEIKTSKQKTNNKKNRASQPISPKLDTPQFIDDPDELLMSVAIRELNKPNPDSRWANILIACKKEKITNKTNVMDQFRQLPTKALVTLLSKNLQEGL